MYSWGKRAVRGVASSSLVIQRIVKDTSKKIDAEIRTFKNLCSQRKNRSRVKKKPSKTKKGQKQKSHTFRNIRKMN